MNSRLMSTEGAARGDVACSALGLHLVNLVQARQGCMIADPRNAHQRLSMAQAIKPLREPSASSMKSYPELLISQPAVGIAPHGTLQVTEHALRAVALMNAKNIGSKSAPDSSAIIKIRRHDHDNDPSWPIGNSTERSDA